MSDKWTQRKNNNDPIGGYTETHPSYGVIGVSRVSGRGVLFGSEVQHQHFIKVTISEARRVVNPPREFVMSEQELVQIYMTDAQFAQMITSPNQSDGVACTINRCIDDSGKPWVTSYGGRPDPPTPEHYTQKYKDVMGKRAGMISEHIAKAKTHIDALMNGTEKPTKGNLKALQDALHMAQMNFDKNIPYVMEEMSEGIEKKVSTAKSEFESYVAHSLQSKGLEHLSQQAPRLNTFLSLDQFHNRPSTYEVLSLMPVKQITKTVYQCTCACKTHPACPRKSEPWTTETTDKIPARCASCQCRTWNRAARISAKAPLTFKGKTQSVAAWSRELKLAKTTIPWRLKQNWPMDQVLSKEDWRFQK